MTEIQGRAAVVTGGGSGMGRAIALALAEAGAAIAIADIVPESAESAKAEIEARGGRAMAIHCDVTDRDMVFAMRDEATRRLGPVSLLVANAGAIMIERLQNMTAGDIDWLIQASLNGTINCIQALLPGMIEAGNGGHIVSTSSASAIVPHHLGRNPVYVAAKTGLFGMMLHMRKELAADDIGATVLCPGAVTTGFSQAPLYRPAKFGTDTRPMPKADPAASHAAFKPSTETFRPAEDVGRMVVEAIRADRAVVVTDASHREKFLAGPVASVLAAFDAVDRFDAAR